MSQVAASLLFFRGKRIAPAQPLHVRIWASLCPISQMGFPERMEMRKLDFSRHVNHSYKYVCFWKSESSKSELIPVSPRFCLWRAH